MTIKSFGKKVAQYKREIAAAGGFGALAMQHANAAIDLTGVQAGLTAAQASGETVGGYVVVAVAALVVIGVIVTIVKKL